MDPAPSYWHSPQRNPILMVFELVLFRCVHHNPRLKSGIVHTHYLSNLSRLLQGVHRKEHYLLLTSSAHVLPHQSWKSGQQGHEPSVCIRTLSVKVESPEQIVPPSNWDRLVIFFRFQREFARVRNKSRSGINSGPTHWSPLLSYPSIISRCYNLKISSSTTWPHFLQSHGIISSSTK